MKIETKVFDVSLINNDSYDFFNTELTDILVEYIGSGFDEECTNFRFFESDDLINWDGIGATFAPTNDPVVYSIRIENKKRFLICKLMAKDEATVGKVTVSISGK